MDHLRSRPPAAAIAGSRLASQPLFWMLGSRYRARTGPCVSGSER